MSEKRNNAWIWGTLAILAGVLIVFAVVLWRVGIFEFETGDGKTKIIAATLSLLGALVASMLTFLGVLLKRSVDERNLALKEEAEGRLRMETEIRAVGLLSTGSGNPVPMEQRAGALFALANLGRIPFALALLSQMWPKQQIDSASACWIIDRALQSGSHTIQGSAATILDNNAHLLPDGQGSFEWPPCLDREWDPGLAYDAKHGVINALLRAIISKEFSYWDREVLNALILIVDHVRTHEPDQRIKSSTVVVLSILLKNSDAGQELYNSEGSVSLDKIREEIEAEKDRAWEVSPHYVLTQALDEWIAE